MSLNPTFIISNIIHDFSLRQSRKLEKLDFNHGMLSIHRPTISANGCIIAQRFLRLYRARVAAPADSLKIIRVVEQGQISFMRFDMVNNGRAWVRAAIG